MSWFLKDSSRFCVIEYLNLDLGHPAYLTKETATRRFVGRPECFESKATSGIEQMNARVDAGPFMTQ